ncbi:MAG: glycosyltransferase family 1 protein [Patescibacteria group bacterium]
MPETRTLNKASLVVTMKILIDARLYGLENTGLGRYTMRLIDSLSRIDKKNEYFILLREKYFNQLNLPANWQKVLADFRHYGFAEQLKLPGLIKSLNPNVVHFVHFNVPVFYKGPFVVTIHDLLMHREKGIKATTLPAPVYFTKRLGYKTVFRFAVARSLAVIVPSEAIKKEIIEYYGTPKDKISVTYEGVDALPGGKNTQALLTKYNLKPYEYFIYTGNAYPHKNLERAMEALAHLNKEREEPIAFAIACARSVFTEKLEKLVSRMDAQKYVKLLGFVPDGELGVLYKNSLAFLFPSLSEGFGLTGLEAILSGSIACISDIPVFKEVYKKEAVYFNPYEPSSMTRAMREVVGMQPGERVGRIKNAQKFAKRYSWDKMAKQTLKVYEDCAGLRPGK